MDLAQFRLDFPEFASTTQFTDHMLTFWSGLAEKQILETRWLDLYAYGVKLCTAHYLALAAADIAQVAGGGIPGASNQGAISSQSVGDVSVSFDTNSGIEPDAGHWNSTSYGRQFIRFARMVGMGGYQL